MPRIRFEPRLSLAHSLGSVYSVWPTREAAGLCMRIFWGVTGNEDLGMFALCIWVGFGGGSLGALFTPSSTSHFYIVGPLCARTFSPIDS